MEYVYHMRDPKRALSTHPKKAFMSSGTIDRIMDDLDTLGETQRELRAEYIRTKAQFN